MKAVVIKQFGGPEVLTVAERPIPKVGEDEVLIRVKAAGVNRPDVLQRMGKYPAPSHVANDIPGLEVSGYIVEIGKNVSSRRVGEKIMALVAGGGYAEFVCAHHGATISLTDDLTLEHAAALPETIYTVWHNVFERGGLQSGERILIHGGAGGIGSTAIQLAKAMGAQVITTVSNPQKEEFVKSLGADEIINYKESDFESILQANKVDLILDYIGGEYFNKNINVLNNDGRLVYINAMDGAKVSMNLLKLMQKRLTITGSTLRNRSNEFKATLTSQIVKNVLPHILNGQITIPVTEAFSFDKAPIAHKMMEKGDVLGKIILIF